MMTREITCRALALCALSLAVGTASGTAADVSPLAALLARRSPAPQPYPYVNGGRIDPSAVSPDAFDPLAAYRWDNPGPDSKLQVYVTLPVAAEDRTRLGHFSGLETVRREACSVRVTGPGVLLVDFGVELPAWFEFDSPDLSGTVTCSVSEYRDKASIVFWKGKHKTAAPVRCGETTYRLKLNRELYEGVRYAFINVEKFERPFTITGLRAVVQVMPVNYTGRFDSDNPTLNKIWQAAAWTVRANLREDCFGAILMDRGDRFSWTGDAYTSQAASLTAFSNYGAVLKNLTFTESHGNAIESYELYWVESLIDYYFYSGDARGVRGLLPAVYKRLDHADAIFDNIRRLGFVGWDERTGVGFDHPECEQNKMTYKMLAIGAWKHAADLLERLGERERAAHYRAVAARRTAALPTDFISRLGMHAAADAINAGLVDDVSRLYHPDLSDRLQRLSYSPFNQCFLLQAMAAAGRYDDAFASIFDMWGSALEYGATCGFEVYRPGWNAILGKNGPVPYTQAGHTSLAHPWGAGVLTWLTEEMLGIKPLEPGFARVAVTPHLYGCATRVAGRVMTPRGEISASFDIAGGRHTLVVPEGTRARLSIPREGMIIERVRVEAGAAALSRARDEGDFLVFDDLGPGSYAWSVTYRGTPRTRPRETFRYAARYLGEDRCTRGDWFRKFGTKGYFIVGADGKDHVSLPDFVSSVTFDTAGRPVSRHRSGEITPFDERARLATRPDGTGPRAFSCWFSSGLNLCPVDIRVKERRPYKVSLYIADCRPGRGGRVQSIDAFDLETLNRIAPPVRVDELSGGVYVTFEYDRSIRFRSQNIRGDNAVIYAVFFD
jgi:hypothetical protein